jgi:ABC-type multidrug transport system permease subunit
MKKMKLQNQIVLVNASILAGLVFGYFRGAPIFAIVVSGVVLLLLANVIFFIRVRKAKNKQ